MKNSLTVISGADIGGSCYLLDLYGVRILFDCGIRAGSEYTEHTDIPSPETIDAIFISHAHLDHMGAIAYTAAVCKNAKIYMTAYTKEFVQYQLAATIGEYIGAYTDDLKFHNRILCRLIMNRVETVDFLEKKHFIAANGETCKFSLFHAGHIPGAAMVFLKVRAKTVLYTGDFSACDTKLTFPYSIPDEVKAETVIMCGTHSNDPDYEVYSNDALSEVTRRIYSALSRNARLVIPVSQLTKGLELLALLDEMISNETFPKSNIYLEEDLWELSRYYEQTSDTFRLPWYIKPLSELDVVDSPKPIIVFEHTGCDMRRYPGFKRVNAEFTLHADYRDLVDFLWKKNPRRVFIVHAASGEGALLDELLSKDLECIVYTENKAVYDI